MTSHSFRPFIPSEANREEPRTYHNGWRKFYERETPAQPPTEVRNPFFAPSSAPPPPPHDWRDPRSQRPRMPSLGEGDSRRLNFPAPPSGRGNMPPPPRAYDPVYPDPPVSSERPIRIDMRGGDWPERPVAGFNERLTGSDRWNSTTASSSARDQDRDWDRESRGPRGWGVSRHAASPTYLHSDRPLLEPSQAWKDRERRLSLEHGTPTAPSSSNVSDFQVRRFHQQIHPPPPPPPPGRPTYGQFSSMPFPRRPAPRRRQQRISARISARPKREPSPSSSESSQRSRSRSLSSRPPYVPPRRGRGRAAPAGDTGVTMMSQIGQSPLTAPIPGLSSVPSNNFSILPSHSPSRGAVSPSRRMSPSPSWSTQSSIRSSVHSSPRLVATELEPTILGGAISQMADEELVPTTETAAPQEDTEFELPGMLFLKDGAPKPWLQPANVKKEEPDNSQEKVLTSGADLNNFSGTAVVEATKTEVICGVVTETSDYAQAQDRDSSVEKMHSSVLSPLSVLSQSADHSVGSLQASQSSPVSQKKLGESQYKEQDASHVAQKRDTAVESARREMSDADLSGAIDPAIVGSESSPLSEPLQLSPAPDVPNFQEDADEESSMEIDDDSSSTSSTSSSPADDIAAALRVFVKARDGKDLQTRSERYSPILHANHALLDLPCIRIGTSNQELVREVLANSLQSRLETHAAVSRTLLDRFTRKAEESTARTRRLRSEYKSYHDRWVANCRKLDQNMASSASQGVEGLPVPSGRVTRRSAAFGDTVRSDLEMEQIIASLGNEDMTDPNVLAIRNTAIIPDLISTDPFSIDLSFDDNNGLLDDPSDFYETYDALGRWTDEEKETFVQKYGVYPKQFGAIASFLPNKTPAQCVMFYYLHKKELIDFRTAISMYGPKRRRRGGRKAGKGKGNALLADIVKPPRNGADEDGASHKHSNRFVNGGLGRPPARQSIATRDSEGRPHHLSRTPIERLTGLYYPRPLEDLGSDADSPRLNQQRLSRSILDEEDKAGTVVSATIEDRRKRQARISIQKPAQNPHETDVNVEPSKMLKPDKKNKEKRPPGRPPKKSKERARALEKSAASSLNSRSTTSYVWSKGEEAIYLELVARHGKDFKKIAEEMPAKTALQCRNYFRNHAKDLDLERIAKQSDSSVTPAETICSNNINTSIITSKVKRANKLRKTNMLDHVVVSPRGHSMESGLSV